MSQPGHPSTSDRKRAAALPGYLPYKRTILGKEIVLFVPVLVKERIEQQEQERRLREHMERRQAEVVAQAERAEQSRIEQEKNEAAAQVARAKEQIASASPVRPPKRPRNTVAIYDWSAALERVQSLKTAPGSGDKDVVKRDIKHFEQAMANGPWRRIAPVAGWRSALAKLSGEMPNFAPVITFIAQRLALSELSKVPLKPPPILLLGDPGVGKTHFAGRLAEVLGTTVYRHSFDNSQANAALRGSDRYWGNTQVGALWTLLMLGKQANPVVVLDELDKAKAEGTGYRPADELLTLLEPVSSSRVKDQSVNFEFDASHVWYIATGNYAKQISAPIRSRFVEFKIESPDIEARLILANSIYRQTLESLFPLKRIRARFVPPTNLQICRLAWLTPRQIRKTSESVLAAAVLASRWHLDDADFDEALRHVESSQSATSPPKKDGGEPFAALILGVR